MQQVDVRALDRDERDAEREPASSGNEPDATQRGIRTRSSSPLIRSPRLASLPKEIPGPIVGPSNAAKSRRYACAGYSIGRAPSASVHRDASRCGKDLASEVRLLRSEKEGSTTSSRRADSGSPTSVWSGAPLLSPGTGDRIGHASAGNKKVRRYQ